jgi:hypothetical protein
MLEHRKKFFNIDSSGCLVIKPLLISHQILHAWPRLYIDFLESILIGLKMRFLKDMFC